MKNLPKCPACRGDVRQETVQEALERGAGDPGWRCEDLSCIPVLEYDGQATEQARERLLGPIRASASGGEVRSAATDHVAALKPQVAMVLDALGHPEAWVTDESKVGDFRGLQSSDTSDREAEAETALWLSQVAFVLGTGVGMGDYIWQVAQRLCGRGDLS